MDSREAWRNADIANRKRITITIDTNETNTDLNEENVTNETTIRSGVDKINSREISKEQHNERTIIKQSENCSETSFAKPFNIEVELCSKRIRDGLEKDVKPITPCEYTLHTLCIHASTSPTPSVMFRPPLTVRFWKVITDFTTAFFICIQVNRDCLFCFAFFAAFIVSAYYLTGFFYRSLSGEADDARKSSRTQT